MATIENRRRFLQTSLTAGTALTLGATNTTHGDSRVAAAAENPQVRPGRVRWHNDFADACAAARGSGKPVLLFHMMGRLDQKFC